MAVAGYVRTREPNEGGGYSTAGRQHVFSNQSDVVLATPTHFVVLVQNMGHTFVQVGSKPIDPSLGQIAQDMVNFFDSYTEGR